jgi:hypothetical protein
MFQLGYSFPPYLISLETALNIPIHLKLMLLRIRLGKASYNAGRVVGCSCKRIGQSLVATCETSY